MSDVSKRLVSGPEKPRLLLAHGAGAAMDSDFMNQMAQLLAKQGIGVVRFEFPYMAERRVSGKKRPPDRQDKLLACWQDVVASYANDGPVFIGGKSMGGRMATLLVDQLQQDQSPLLNCIKGVVCLGYPFHPPGKPEKLRTEHLGKMPTPVLIAQGSRDAMGTKAEVESYNLSETVELLWLEDGNHDLKPRVKSGFTQQQHLACAAQAVAEFMAD